MLLRMRWERVIVISSTTSIGNVLIGRKRTLEVSSRRDTSPLERKPSADADENSLWRP